MPTNDQGVTVQRQYIGARYVPKFFQGPDGSPAWIGNIPYEPMTIVTYLGNSYTSKIPVTSGIGNPANNPTYWALTGAYNAQVGEYQQQVEEYKQLADQTATSLQTETTNREQADANLNNQIQEIKTEIEGDIISPLKGKKILIVGDSLSIYGEADQHWTDIAVPIMEDMGATVVVNSVRGRRTANSGVSVIPDLPSMPKDCDIVLIFLGINDIFGQVNLDVPGSANNETFGGALMSVIAAFKNTTTRIIWVTPLKTVPNDGTVLHIVPDAYRLMIQQTAYLRGIEVIDAGGYAPNYLPSGVFTADGVHMSVAYQPVFADYIIRELMYTSHSYNSNVNVTKTYTQMTSGASGSVLLEYCRGGGVTLYINVTSVNAADTVYTLPQWLRPKYDITGTRYTINSSGNIIALQQGYGSDKIMYTPNSQLVLTTTW